MTNHPNRSQTPAFRAAELAALLARHYPEASVGAIADIVGDMQRATRAAKHHAEALCSYAWAEAKAEAWTRQESRAEARLNYRLSLAALDNLPPEIARHEPATLAGKHPAPATVTLGGDPRGPCGRLAIPGQRGDGWDEGFAIY